MPILDSRVETITIKAMTDNNLRVLIMVLFMLHMHEQMLHSQWLQQLNGAQMT